MVEIKGQCLCGEVKYAVKGPIGDILHCHCSECRKWHGSAFRTRTTVKKKDFFWLAGQELVAMYKGLPSTTKTFCRMCGSNLISYYRDNEEVIGLPLGGIEGELGQTPKCHIFVGNKADWYEINDDLPQYADFPNGETNIHK